MAVSFALTDNIQWPVIIQLYGDDELIYVADAEQFVADETLHQLQFQPQDKVIDSQGNVYSISTTSSLTLTAAESRVTLPQIENLLRLHLSSEGNCCVAKFHANSISEAILYAFA